MGVFLALSGVMGADEAAVADSVAEYALWHGGTWEPIQAGKKERDTALIATEHGNTSLLYPGHFTHWDQVAEHLSADLQAAVFSCHIHDGDLWMFILFDKGEAVAWFNPVPDYWIELDADERAQWRGDAAAVAARVPHLAPADIDRYFVEWDLGGFSTDRLRAAYADDAHGYGDCWQMLDFLRKVGLPFPSLTSEGPAPAAYCLRLP